MAKMKFEYVTYIAAQPETVWNALLDPEITRVYWQHVNLSDWKPGSKWEHRTTEESRELHMVGRVVESKKPNRLVFSWAFPADEAHEEKHTRVTYNIEAYHGVTRLTVTHDRLEPGSDMQTGITEGWPMVLSSLKTLLETGKALPVLW